MSPFDVSVRQLVKRALSKNDLKAVLAFIGLCESYGIIAPMPPAEHGGGVLVVPPWDWNEWLQMFEQHGPPPWPGERSDLPDETGGAPNQEERMMANHKSKGSNQSAEPDDGPEANAGGYGKPPRHGRFKPGQSGNPRGRPRGAKGRKQTVAKIANEMHWVGEDGNRRRRSTLELVILQLRNLAAQGNVQAFRAYNSLLARYSPERTETLHGYMIVPEVLTIEAWERLAVEVQAYQRRLEEEAEEQGRM